MLPTMEKQFEIEENTAPVRRLIDGKEVLYKMREILPPFEETGEWYENADPKEIMEMVDELYNIVQCQPTIETQEVVHAKWNISCDGYYPYCSNCKKEPQGREMTKWCPNCGAKMDLEE